MSQTAQELAWPEAPAPTAKNAVDTVEADTEIERLLAITERPDVISFAMGLPAKEAFPMEALTRASAAVLASEGAASMQYCPTPGITGLRESIASRMSEMTGGAFSAQNILVTSGAQQALDLVGRELLCPGDRMGVETPTYFGALAAWQPLGLRYQPIGFDDRGAVQAGRAPPALAYIQPRFRNPTGSSLTRAQKEALMAFSHEHGMRIIEDDAYAALSFDPGNPDTRLPLIAQGPFGTLGYEGDVIYLGTVSKLIAPALRTGWVAARPETIARLTAAKQGMDLCGSAFGQHLVNSLLSTTVDSAYVDGLRALYSERCDRLVRALEEYLPSQVSFERPEGGLFLWLSFPRDWDAGALLDVALKERVAFYPGRAFFAGSASLGHARLNFASAPANMLEEGAQRLARAIDIYAKTRRPD